MTLLLLSFFAGVLTVLAPCILPLLPIIVGGSVADAHAKWKPFIITASLAVSIIVFTLALKVSEKLIDIPQSFWTGFSGGILILFGIVTIFPRLWERIAVHFTPKKANVLLAKGVQRKSFLGDVMIGAALGPVFSSCSPTYFWILATVLPVSFAQGFVYLIAYALGLSAILLLIAFLGQKLTSRLEGAANPHGIFKRTLGVLFLLVGIAIITGFDKSVESRLLDFDFYLNLTNFEGGIIDNLDEVR